MQEAIRSIAEWIASVRIATEPVAAPANSLSTIRKALEAIETAAARVRSWPVDAVRAWPVTRPATRAGRARRGPGGRSRPSPRR